MHFPPPNVPCQVYYQGPEFNATGFVLFYFTRLCTLQRNGDNLGDEGGGGVDTFLSAVAKEYFKDSKQIIVLYDESWEISSMIEKVSVTTTLSFVTYFLPLKISLGKRIKSKLPDHLSHRVLPKGTSFIVFVKDEIGFSNIFQLTSAYPWWNKRGKMVVLVKEKSLGPTKGILNFLESEKMFSAIVVTQVSDREDSSGLIGSLAPSDPEDDQGVGLQIASLDPYPIEGDPKHFFVARWGGGKFTARLRPLFQEKASNLQGHQLKAAVFQFPPLVFKDTKLVNGSNVTEIVGLEVKIFKELSRILNFTFRFYEVEGEERWGNDAVDITVPYDQDRGCFAVPRPEALQHWLGLILPFSWQVWACVFSMALVSGPIFTLISRQLKVDPTISIGNGIMYALGSLVSSQKAPKAKSSSLRAFVIAWLIFCWLATILYRVSLIISLTIGPSDWKIDTIKQLVRAGLEWGGYEEVIKTFTNTSDPEDRTLFDRFVPLTDIEEALERVAKDADFAVMDSGKFLRYAANGKYFNGWSSAIHVTKECPTSFNVGFAVPIGSPFIDKINENIRRMQNAGLIEKWLKDIIYEARLKNRDKTAKRKFRSLSVDHLKLCLVVFLGGNFLAGWVCFIERIKAKYGKTGKEMILRRVSRRISMRLSTSANSLVSLESVKSNLTSEKKRNPEIEENKENPKSEE